MTNEQIKEMNREELLMLLEVIPRETENPWDRFEERIVVFIPDDPTQPLSVGRAIVRSSMSGNLYWKRHGLSWF